MGKRTTVVKVDGKGFKQTGAEAKEMSSSIGGISKSALKAGAAIIGIVAAVAVARKAISFFTSSIDALGKQEEAERSLALAIKNTASARDESVDALKAQAAALQQVTVFGDEAILQAQSLLIAMGGLSGEGLQRATMATLNLSSALGTDLKTSALLMAKAAAGMTSSLSRYGIILDKNIPDSEKFAAVLTQIEEKFGGLAKEVAKTSSGKIKQLANAWGDVQEEIAQVLVDTGAFDGILDLIRDGMETFKRLFTENPDFIKNVFAAGLEFAKALLGAVQALIPLLNTVLDIVTPLLPLLGLVGQAVGFAVKFSPLGLLAGAIGRQPAPAPAPPQGPQTINVNPNFNLTITQDETVVRQTFAAAAEQTVVRLRDEKFKQRVLAERFRNLGLGGFSTA